MAQSYPLKPRFEVGAKVRISDRSALGHCRTPFYLRGHSGVVVGIQGAHPDPERLAYHKPGLPLEVVYKVRFRQSDLWADYHGPRHDHLEADISENWLEATK